MPDAHHRKVAFVLAELGLSYEPKYLDLNKGDQKSPEYTQYNPNGRIPTLVDHSNNDFTIWCVFEVCEREVFLTARQGVQRDHRIPRREIRHRATHLRRGRRRASSTAAMALLPGVWPGVRTMPSSITVRADVSCMFTARTMAKLDGS